MTEFTFLLSSDDTDRLYAIKDLAGYKSMSGNDYARLLLERELQRLFPAIPEYDDAGLLANPESYKGF